MLMRYLTLLLTGAVLFCGCKALGRDTTGLSDMLTPEQQTWTRGLRGYNNQLCCDHADGIDPDWDMTPTGYIVRWRGEWLKVRPDALITAPNKLGVARAWVWLDETGKWTVKCFLPGPATKRDDNGNPWS